MAQRRGGRTPLRHFTDNLARSAMPLIDITGQRFGRLTVLARAGSGVITCAVACPLRLWKRKKRSRASPPKRRYPILRLPAGRGHLCSQQAARPCDREIHADLQIVALDDGSLSLRKGWSLPRLPPSGDHRLRAVARSGRVRELPRRHRRATSRHSPRPTRQRRELRTWKLPLGDAAMRKSNKRSGGLVAMRRRD